MIIALCGKRRSGKDTVGAYLMKHHGFERKAFADPLKKATAILFDIPFSDVDKLKLDELIHVTLETWPEYKDDSEVIRTQTFLQFLQRFGTDVARDLWGIDFWVEQTLPVQAFYKGRAIVVTDCRFESEAARVRLLDGYIVKIVRPLDENAALSVEHQHRSETELDTIRANYQILNDGSLEDLYEQVEDMLEVIGEK